MPKTRRKPDIHRPLAGAGGGATIIGGGGGGTQPGTITLQTGNTMTGLLHVHQMDLSPHLTNAAAHHAPVTVGNTGLSLSTQQLSLNLAAVSGLEINAGLRLADSIAGAGLTIASKVLALGTPTTLTHATADAVTATSHSHAVSALASTVGGEQSLLKSDEFGGLGLAALSVAGGVTVGQGLTAAASAFRVIHHTHDYAHAHLVVNPSTGWALDEQFGVDIDDSLLVRGYIVGKHALQIADAAMICHYDGPEPYETDYTGNPTGHRGQVATVTGGVIYRPGKYGKAVQVAGGTTNLVTNPSFETGTAGWTQYGTYGFGRTAEVSLYGGYSLKIDRRATGDWEGMYTSVTVTEGRTYTFSAYGRLGSGAPAGALAVNGCGISGTVVMARSTSWERASVTGTATSTGTVQVRVFSAGGAVGDTLYVDAVQVEEQPCATPYCDGSLGAGHAWAGAPHASTSTRAAGGLTYAQPLPASGPFAVSMWLVPAATAEEIANSNNRCIWQAGTMTTATRSDLWVLQSSGARLSWFSGAANSSLNTETTATFGPGDCVHVVCTWDGIRRRIYVDGLLDAVSGDESATPPPIGPTLYVGTRATGYQFNGLIDDLLVVKRALDADEVRAIYESDAPVFAETSTWQWRAGRNLVWADADGLWAVDETGAAMFAVSGTTKSWGGASLGAGDVFVGNVAQGHYLHWDDSAAALVIKGQITIQAGSSGIASLSDAGALATKNAVDLATGEVLNKSADNIAEGTTRKWAAESGADITGNHTAHDTSLVDGTAAATVKGGATRANAGLDVSGNVARLIRGSDLGAGSGVAVGLNLTSTNMGYYDGSSWPVFISSQGYFQFQKDANNYFKWDGTTFEFKGRVVVTAGTTVDTLPDGSTYGKVNKTIISGGNIRVGTGTKDSTLNGWNIDSTEIVGQASGVDQVVLGTDGKIKAGAGKTVLGSTGLNIQADILADGGTDPGRIAGGRITWLRSSTYHGSVSAGSHGDGAQYSLSLQVGTETSLRYTALTLWYDPVTYEKRVNTNGSFLATGRLETWAGLRVGYHATMAPGEGQLYVVKSVGVGINYTPGDGNVDASGYVRGQKGLIVGEGQSAPTAASGIAFIWVDSNGNLKITFGDGTTKTIISKA